MHKFTIFMAIIFGMVFTLSANAAIKCVALDSSASCSGTSKTEQPDWSITCNNISVRGIGVCSSTSGSIGQTASTIVTSSTIEDNIYCWCKMISPGSSNWVYVNDLTYADYCHDSCAYDCAGYITSESAIRKALFSNMQ